MTKAQYDQVLNRVSPGNVAPTGLISHVAGISETGICVSEVWESMDSLNAFSSEKLGQAMQEAGTTVQPKTFEILNEIKG